MADRVNVHSAQEDFRKFIYLVWTQLNLPEPKHAGNRAAARFGQRVCVPSPSDPREAGLHPRIALLLLVRAICLGEQEFSDVPNRPPNVVYKLFSLP